MSIFSAVTPCEIFTSVFNSNLSSNSKIDSRSKDVLIKSMSSYFVLIFMQQKQILLLLSKHYHLRFSLPKTKVDYIRTFQNNVKMTY